LRKAIVYVSAFLLAACAARPAPPPAEAPMPAAQDQKPAARVKAGTVEEIASVISKNLTSSERARMAFSAHRDETSKKLAERLITLFPKSFSLALIGLDGAPPEEALSQLDARTTHSLVYLFYRKDGDLLVSLYATDGSFSRDLLFDYSYGDPKTAVSHDPKRLGIFPMKVDAAACDGTGNIYVLGGGKVSVLPPDASKEFSGAAFACGRAMLFTADGAVSAFCAGTSAGKTFTMKDHSVQVKESSSFPLPERAGRFLYADNDDQGVMTLFDKADNSLASFVELCVFRNSAGTTVFAGISPEGGLWGLRGDLVSLVPNALKGPYSRLAPAGASLFALRADGEVERIQLDDKFEWTVSEMDLKTKEKPSAIACSGESLFIFCPDGNSTAVYSVPVPRSGKEGE